MAALGRDCLVDRVFWFCWGRSGWSWVGCRRVTVIILVRLMDGASRTYHDEEERAEAEFGGKEAAEHGAVLCVVRPHACVCGWVWESP